MKKLTTEQLKKLIVEVIKENHNLNINIRKDWKVTYQDDRRLPDGWSVDVTAFNKREAIDVASHYFEQQFDQQPYGLAVDASIISDDTNEIGESFLPSSVDEHFVEAQVWSSEQGSNEKDFDKKFVTFIVPGDKSIEELKELAIQEFRTEGGRGSEPIVKFLAIDHGSKNLIKSKMSLE